VTRQRWVGVVTGAIVVVTVVISATFVVIAPSAGATFVVIAVTSVIVVVIVVTSAIVVVIAPSASAIVVVIAPSASAIVAVIAVTRPADLGWGATPLGVRAWAGWQHRAGAPVVGEGRRAAGIRTVCQSIVGLTSGTGEQVQNFKVAAGAAGSDSDPDELPGIGGGTGQGHVAAGRRLSKTCRCESIAGGVPRGGRGRGG
jgi:hypothetical protein